MALQRQRHRHAPGPTRHYHFGEARRDLSDLASPAGSEDHGAVLGDQASATPCARAWRRKRTSVPEQVWDPATQAGPWWEEELREREI